MDLEIITRFRFEDGRAYIFNSNFETAYKSIFNAVNHLDETIHSKNIEEVQGYLFSLTHAIMWGDDNGNKMIDFFGIGKNCSLDGDWNSNPDIFSWVTRDGLIVPRESISEVTCGKGFIILGEEERYRRSTSQETYLSIPPKIEGLVLRAKDYSTEQGRVELGQLMKSR
ncbi:MAG: hypothetical protein AABW63_01395 [Nanoarchaeota archaeon]